MLAFRSQEGDAPSSTAIWLWFAAIWTMSVPYLFLKSRLQALIHYTPSNSEELQQKRRKLHKIGLVWAGWLAAIMIVWIILGTSALTFLHTDDKHPYFILGNRSFIYLTIIGQISTVLFLCVNRLVIFSVLLAVVISTHFSVKDLGIPPSNLYVFYYGAMVLNVFIAWFLNS